MKLIAALLKFILTSARKHNVGRGKKKAIYSSSLQYGASPGAEIAAEGRIISSQLMGDANKAVKKNPQQKQWMRKKIPPNLFHLLSASFDQTVASPPPRPVLSVTVGTWCDTFSSKSLRIYRTRRIIGISFTPMKLEVSHKKRN